jgi:hypothetical protein
VSNIPRSIPLLLVHFGALTRSPERPRRPFRCRPSTGPEHHP